MRTCRALARGRSITWRDPPPVEGSNVARHVRSSHWLSCVRTHCDWLVVRLLESIAGLVERQLQDLISLLRVSSFAATVGAARPQLVRERSGVTAQAAALDRLLLA